MSDGPHRSLPMPPRWKRVAERCANVAFSTDEITTVLIPALRQDCESQMSPGFIDGIRNVLDDQGSSLFKDEVIHLRGVRLGQQDQRPNPGFNRAVECLSAVSHYSSPK